VYTCIDCETREKFHSTRDWKTDIPRETSKKKTQDSDAALSQSTHRPTCLKFSVRIQMRIQIFRYLIKMVRRWVLFCCVCHPNQRTSRMCQCGCSKPKHERKFQDKCDSCTKYGKKTYDVGVRSQKRGKKSRDGAKPRARQAPQPSLVCGTNETLFS
jgi:hypothetical protein